ncbi:hypothetical protein CRE_09440 [Caenorhabditis remanei]|uniref:F-box domain-containing protein n=1 Tax=Caenorhabditis remanei TaxID=31234 RepID=E3LIV9_CAERE|nr:hypothetical protein CRE_09440 [Caenorhabditis remanei]
MTTEVSLPQLPDNALSAIMEKLDFRSILSLRKVSRSFHTSIDKLKPDFPVTHLLLSFNCLRISPFINIKYEAQENGLLRTLEIFENGASSFEKLMEEGTVSDAYSKDLTNILKYRKVSFGGNLHRYILP